MEFMIFNKTIDFMKVLTSKIIYDDKIFDKTINFMKVLISKIFMKSLEKL
jgi:hypothetical protein